MTFANPLFFWAALSLIPLVTLYFLKVRPRRKSTTAYFLWEQIFQEKRTTSLLRRLRDFWSLLLMLLVFAAIVLALSGPQWADDERKDALLVIDHSASMSAREGNTTRLDLAKEQATDIVRAFNGSQRAAVASLGRDLIYHSHLSDNPRQLLEAIETIQPSDQGFRSEAIASSASADQFFGEYRVILFSDGCFDRGTLPEHVELLKVGGPRGNVGLVAADMQYVPGPDRPLGFYFQVASTFKEPVQVDLLVSRLDDNGQEDLQRLVPLEVKTGLNDAQVITIENAEPGRWTARLDRPDALASDNVAYLAVAPPRPVRVTVESDDRFFLENSVIAFSRHAGLLTLSDTRPQVVLAKSVTPDVPLSMIFQPQGDSPWWSDLGDEMGITVPRLLVDDHPALRYADAASIPFVGARRLTAPHGAQVLVATDDGVPLIYRAAQDGKTAIVVNMDPVASEFYYSAWFPVLVHSAVRYLAGREETLMASYRPGDVVTVPGVQAGETTSIVGPAGGSDEVNAKTLPPLERLGFYQMNNKSGDWSLACSLLSQDETLLDNEQVEDTSQPISRGWTPAHWLTVLAIITLVVESLLYHRRKVG